jgi:hypothetical protein
MMMDSSAATMSRIMKRLVNCIANSSHPGVRGGGVNALAPNFFSSSAACTGFRPPLSLGFCRSISVWYRSASSLRGMRCSS